MIEFEIKDMSCGHCVGAVTRAVKTLDAQADIKIDLGSKTMTVESAQSRESLAAALTDAGYPPA